MKLYALLPILCLSAVVQAGTITMDVRPSGIVTGNETQYGRARAFEIQTADLVRIGYDNSPIIDFIADTITWTTLVSPHYQPNQLTASSSIVSSVFVPPDFPTPGGNRITLEPYTVTYDFGPSDWEVTAEFEAAAIEFDPALRFFAKNPMSITAPAVTLDGTATIDFDGQTGVLPFTIHIDAITGARSIVTSRAISKQRPWAASRGAEASFQLVATPITLAGYQWDLNVEHVTQMTMVPEPNGVASALCAICLLGGIGRAARNPRFDSVDLHL